MAVNPIKILFNKTSRCAEFQIFILVMQIYVFRAVCILTFYAGLTNACGRQTCIKCASADCTVDNS